MNKQELIDNSWYERGELPPVWVECEYKFANPAYDWTPVKVNYISENHAILVCLSDGKEVHTDGFTVAKFRPIKSDREKFVDAALAVMQTKRISNTQRKTINRLYDAGFRAPE